MQLTVWLNGNVATLHDVTKAGFFLAKNSKVKLNNN